MTLQEKDRAIIAVNSTYKMSEPDGYLLACDGPKRCGRNKDMCAFDLEWERSSDHISDLGIGKQFHGKPVGLYVWEGLVDYCEGNCSYDSHCDCDVEFKGEIRNATAEDLIAFKLLNF